MGFWEIALIVVCAVLVVGVTIAAVVRRAGGKGNCGCDCSHCSACTHCASAQSDNAVDSVESKQ